jgi:hypothetical protein
MVKRSCFSNAFYMLERCGRLLGHDDTGASIFVLDGKVWRVQGERDVRQLGDYFLHMSLVRKGIRKLIRVSMGYAPVGV